ncbi:glycosyltransferase family A protein [Aridibaculum aurantiacum]|uniref:glycosyltransferase family A protein n=1 Tax=Aridibaculum aurantiacum TaxID=2810307 RepID=UPI001A979472|nr:glycosyltransferase family A protein [Aridibaculum aurantiacum]
MPDKSLVSVIIPFYNSAAYLSEAIESVIKQDYPYVEIILVDDGSSDNSSSIAAGFVSDGILLVKQQNAGASAARNTALKNCKGDFVIFLDADDILLPGVITLLVKEAVNCDMVFGGWSNFLNQRDNIISEVSYDTSLHPLTAFFKYKPTISTVLIRRSQIEKQWDEKMKVWEVTKFFFDIIRTGARVKFIGPIVTSIRQHVSAERITIKYDHFNPVNTALFLLQCKQQLQENGMLNNEVELVIDRELVAYNHLALRKGVDKATVRNNFHPVNWKAIKNQNGFLRTPIYWFIYYLKGFRGLYAFHQINKLLNRG